MAHIQKKKYTSKRTGKTTTVWQARYMAPDGKERTKRFDRQVDADTWLSVNAADLARGMWIDPAAGKISFAEYAETWRASQVHRVTTEAQVASHLKNHLLPTFADRPIVSIRPSEVQAWVKGRSATLGPATVEVAFRYLSAIFKAAVRDRLIAFNPCEGAKLPRPEPRQVEPLETSEVLALIDAMPDRFRASIVLAAGAGLRQGEAMGVTVDRINFPARSLTVDRQLVTVTGRAPFLAPPKTQSSNRSVPLPDFVTSSLAEHMAREGLTIDAGGALMFTTANGAPVPRNRLNDAFRGAVTKAGIARPVRFHDLRHYYASLLIRHGESVKTVQARLGHASAAETLDTYAHLWPDSEDRTRRAVDEVLTDTGRTTFAEKAL